MSAGHMSHICRAMCLNMFYLVWFGGHQDMVPRVFPDLPSEAQVQLRFVLKIYCTVHTYRQRHGPLFPEQDMNYCSQSCFLLNSDITVLSELSNNCALVTSASFKLAGPALTHIVTYSVES
jgi:hypothetical protein